MEDGEQFGGRVQLVSWRQRVRAAMLAGGAVSSTDYEDFQYDFAADVGLLAPGLRARFILNDRDAAMHAFVLQCCRRNGSLLAMLKDSWGHMLLRPFLSRTAVNGILCRGEMFILSTAQFRQHLEFGLPDALRARKRGKLLDIGAGDGGVTQMLDPMFEETHATEFSAVMQWRLWLKGFKCLTPEEFTARAGKIKYDAIACLNVLDRCDKPITLLENMRDSLVPGHGRLIVALVLPYRPFVEQGTKKLPPTERLDIRGTGFEANIASIERNVLQPLGMRLEAFSKAPYLCSGDQFKPYYLLPDAILVVSATPPPPPS